MAQSILARLDPSDIVFDPQPYIVSTEALEPAYYAELAAAYPKLETVAGEGPLENNRAYLMQARQVIENPAIPEVWRDFFAYHTSREFFLEALQFWKAAIEREYPDLEARFGKPLDEVSVGLRRRGKKSPAENRAFDVMMDTQFGMNSPVKTPTSVRGPHVDDVYKLFAGLLYFRRPDDQATGANLNLYRTITDRYYQDGRRDIPERFVESFREVAYRPNTFVMYLNTARSIHGVTPRSVTDVPRRYVNFQGECYNLTTGGFYTVKRSVWGNLGTAARRLVGAKNA